MFCKSSLLPNFSLLWCWFLVEISRNNYSLYLLTMLRVLFLSFLCFLSSVAYVFGQSINEIRHKTAIFPHIIKNVKWENKTDKQLRIAYLGSNLDYIKTLNELKSTGKITEYKDQIIIHFASIKEVSAQKVDILWLDSKLNSSISKVAELLEGTNTLLISSSCSRKENIMINFELVGNKISLEINKINMYAESISITPDLLIYGGTYVDVASIYKRSKAELQKAKEDLERQKDELEELQREVDNDKVRLEENKRILEDQQSQLDAQTSTIQEQEKTLKESEKSVYQSQQKLKESSAKLDAKLVQIDSNKKILAKQKDALEEQEKLAQDLDQKVKRKDQKIEKQRFRILAKDSQIEMQHQVLLLSLVAILIFSVLLFLIFRQNSQNKKMNLELQQVNEKIVNQKELIEQSADELFVSKTQVEKKNLELEYINGMINSGIVYAKRLQVGFMPTAKEFKEFFPESFIYFEPMSELSGDFYFVHEVDDYVVYGVVDCTGHGIPGALLSVLGYNLIQEIVSGKKTITPSEILTKLDYGVYRTLNKRGQNIQDGMDVSLVTMNKSKNELQFSGAKLPLLLKEKNSENLTVFKGSKSSIGGYSGFKKRPFENIVLKLSDYEGGYMFSDGFEDQLGGDENKRVGRRNFYQLLDRAVGHKIEEQVFVFDEYLDNWQPVDKGRNDDITIIGFKF